MKKGNFILFISKLDLLGTYILLNEQTSVSEKMACLMESICLNIVKYILLVLRYTVRMFLVFHYAGQKQVVPPVRKDLLLMSATKMAKFIREGEISCEQFVTSYIDRIYEVQPYVNAVVEERFDAAISEARNVDSMIASKSKTVDQIFEETPLLGVPITVKLMIEVKGMHSNIASKYFQDRIAVDDAEVVELMKNAGAIVIATTNLPDLGLGLDTWNILYGRTNNPYDTTKSTLGSSGGEAAIISSAGSVLGLGNDLAGSLRLPSAFCGIFAHKPSKGTVSVEGAFPVTPKDFLYFGPMSRYGEDLLTSMKILVGKSASIRMGLNKPVDLSKLKVYYINNNNSNQLLSPPVDPDILERLFQAVTALEKKFGATTQALEIKSMKYSFLFSIYEIRFAIEGSLKDYVIGRDKGSEIRIIPEFMKWLFGKSKLFFVPLLLFCFDSTINRILEYFSARALKHKKIIEGTINSVLDENSVLLLPTFPLKSTYHGELPFYSNCLGFTSIFNCFGHPVTQCPLGLDKNGLPIGIQIVASKGNDRLTMKCATELEKIFGGWKPPKDC